MDLLSKKLTAPHLLPYYIYCEFSASSGDILNSTYLIMQRLDLGRFGVLLGGDSSTSKRHVDKQRKPVEMGLKESAGRFVNGCLHVDRLVKVASTPRKEVDREKQGKRKGVNKDHKKNKHKKKGGRGKRH